MKFVTIEDITGSLEILVFPSVFDKFRALTEVGERIFVTGKAGIEATGDVKFIAERIEGFEEVNCKLWIRFPDEAGYAASKQELEEMIDNLEGHGARQVSVIVYCEKEGSRDKWGDERLTTANEEMVEALAEKYGEENVILT